jgi:hypothetical protein
VDWFQQIGGNVGQSGPSAFAVSSSYADVLSAQASRDCVAKYSLHTQSITQESIFAYNGTDGCTLLLECYRRRQSSATEQVLSCLVSQFISSQADACRSGGFANKFHDLWPTGFVGVLNRLVGDSIPLRGHLFWGAIVCVEMDTFCFQDERSSESSRRRT